MKKGVCLLYFLLILFSIGAVDAQPLLNEVVEATYIFRLSQGDNASDKSTNELIREHAYRLGKKAEDIALAMHYDMVVRVNDAGKGGATASIFFQFKSFGGDAQNQKMPFPATLIPKVFEALLVVTDSNNKNSREYMITNSNVEAQCYLSEVRLVGPFLPDIHELSVKQIRFSYDNGILDRYFNFIEQVAEYTAMSEDITLSEEVLRGVRLEEVSGLAQQKEDVDRMGLFLDEVLNSSLIGSLELRIHDPLALLARASDLKSRQLQKKRQLEQKIKGLDIALYNAGVTQALAGKFDSADFYFRQSLLINPRFTPAKAEVALGHFLSGEFAQAESLLFDVLFNGNPDPGTRLRVIEIAQKLYTRYLNEGIAASKDSVFFSAMERFLQAQRICGNFPGVGCAPSLRQVTSKSAIQGYEQNNEKLHYYIKEGKYDIAKALLLTQIGEYYNNQSQWKQLPAYPDNKPIKTQIAAGLASMADRSYNEGAYFLAFSYAQQALEWGVRPALTMSIIEQALKLLKERTPTTTLFVAIEPVLHLWIQQRTGDEVVPFLMDAQTDSFDTYVRSVLYAYNGLNENDFVKAKIGFQEASQYAAKWGNMVLNIAADQRRYVELIIEYFGLLLQAEEARQRSDLPAFFSLYTKAERHYSNHMLYQRLVSHKPLSHVVMDMHTQERYEAMLFYASQDQIHRAIALIDSLKNYKEKKKAIRQMQSIIGEQIAVIEFEKYPNDQPERVIDFYTSYNPELQPMVRAILQKWTSLVFAKE